MKDRTPASFFYFSACCLLCGGCGRAPAIDVIGSFFPVWMVCLTVSVVVAALLRVYLLRRQLEPAVEPVALFYPAVVLLLSCLMWLVFYR